MNNNLEYLECDNEELELTQIICLKPLINNYYNVNYDLTSAISNIINQYSDICIFKIQKKCTDKMNDNKKWVHYKGNEKITVDDKFKVLTDHMNNYKEQFFMQFSLFDKEQKQLYLDQCQLISDYISKMQKDIMYKNRDTSYLEEEVQNFCLENLIIKT